MSPDGVAAKIAAVEKVAGFVQSFAQRSAGAAEHAAAAARECEARVEAEHTRRIAEVKRARAAREAAAAALKACQEDCRDLEAAFREAQRAEVTAVRRADASAKALAAIGEAIRDFAGRSRSFNAALVSHVPGALSSTRGLSVQLQEYLGSGGNSSTTGSTSASRLAVANAVGTKGMEDVDISKVLNDRSAPLTFEKASREQIAWGLDRLKGVIEPALSMGKGADYFAARDAAEGLSGQRSYSGVHNWFYNSDHAIKLTRASGGYTITNGYHRLAVAKELGITNLPALVR